jgi:hypothetical protein
MNLGDHVNAYCERQGPQWTAEPLNAVSNLAFFYWAWRLWRQADAGLPRLARPQRCLAALLALVGAGSLVFHTLATVWGSILDVLFIGVFNVTYLILFLRLVARWRIAWALGGGVAFVLLDRCAGALLPADAINGSVLYLPALAVLFALTAYGYALVPQAGRRMAVAAAVFCVSLLARTLDQTLCTSWPLGTHFIWHLLNGWVLYALSGAMVLGAGAQPGTLPGVTRR